MKKDWVRINCDEFDTKPWLFALHALSQLAWLRLKMYIRERGTRGAAPALAPLVAAGKWLVGEEDVRKMLQAAYNSGALSISEDGEIWQLGDDELYSVVKDDSRERVRVHRERQAASPGEPEEPRESVTGVTPLHAVTGGCNALPCHATSTTTVTEPPPPPTEGDPPPFPEESQMGWWDDPPQEEHGQLCAEVVRRIRGAKGYGQWAPEFGAVADLVGWAMGFAPDESVLLDLVEAFVDRANAHRSTRRRPVEYSDVRRALRSWIQRDEPRWRSLKRNRDLDAELEARKSAGSRRAPGADMEHRKKPEAGIDFVLLPVDGGDIGLFWAADPNVRFSEKLWRAARDRLGRAPTMAECMAMMDGGAA